MFDNSKDIQYHNHLSTDTNMLSHLDAKTTVLK